MELRELLYAEEERKLESLTETLEHDRDKNSYALYNYVNSRTKPKSERFVLRNDDGSIITDEDAIRQKLRDKWGRIYDEQYWPYACEIDPPQSLHLREEDQRNLLREMAKEEVVQAIKDLHPGTSAGTTLIAPEMLRNAPDELVEYIFQWCREVWESGDLPHENEITRSIFLHKKGPTDNLDNYRTLATGCNLCKVYLRVLYNRMYHATEQSNLLGEIQNGFRKSRRTSDNLLILDTVVRKASRAGSKINVALLDICKAYDRVDRDLLWFKLQAYGFPIEVVNKLKQVYCNPMSELMFQGITTEPLHMKIGLRQGCVLSPLLFALFLADLGRLLEESGLGAAVGGIKIPAMFFADDMILMGKGKKQLSKILDIVCDYAIRNKLEFSGPKSVVIPTGRPVDPHEEGWIMGHVPRMGHDHEPIIMKEGENGKYLGILVGRNQGLYKDHGLATLSKFEQNAWLLQTIIKKVRNPCTVFRKLWNVYVIPRILYGTDVIQFKKTHLDDLELAQRRLIKQVFRWPSNTSDGAVYSIPGVAPIEDIILRNKIRYYQYVASRDESRWIQYALKEQWQWAVVDGLIEQDGSIRVPENEIAYTDLYWFKDVVRAYVKLGHEKVVSQTKTDIKILMETRYRDYINNERKSVALQYMDEPWDYIDHGFHKTWHHWWMKARVGGLFLAWRDQEDKLCPMCLSHVETLDHFIFGCEEYTWCAPGAWAQNQQSEWALSVERTFEERKVISTLIRLRYKERKSRLQID